MFTDEVWAIGKAHTTRFMTASADGTERYLSDREHGDLTQLGIITAPFLLSSRTGSKRRIEHPHGI
jgi:hypothetical protein